MNFFDIKWVEVLEVTIRAFFSLAALFLITKILGKKQVSQLSLFDYVIGISIGNFASQMTTDLGAQYINGLVAITIFGLIAYLVSYLTMKSIILRRFFIGAPTILIQNGKLITSNIKKVKFDLNDLQEECRSNGYFDISQIEYALMEANGKLSILPKGAYAPLTVKHMNLKPEKSSLCANIIIDGKVMKKNLKNMHKDEEWLNKEIKIKGYRDFSNILLMTLDINDKTIIYEKKFNEKIHEVLE